MTQALGIALILLGAVMWHIAASGIHASNIGDVWKDVLKTMQGEPLS